MRVGVTGEQAGAHSSAAPIFDPIWTSISVGQGCIFRLMCSHRELAKDHVLTIAYVKIFRTVRRNDVNKSV